MSRDNGLEKSIKVVPFSGKEEDWRMWSSKFLALANLKGFSDVVRGTVVIPNDADTLDESTPDGKEAARVRKANVFAFNTLILSCVDMVAFSAVNEAKTTENPEGDAAKAWSNLKDRFAPQTKSSEMELRREYADLRLTDVGKNPDEFFSEIEHVRQRLASLDKAVILSDSEVMMHILDSLPQDYDYVVTMMEAKLDDTGMSLNYLRAGLRSHYKKIHKRNGVKKDDSDVALAAFTKMFKGRCYTCGEQGHKGSQCPKQGAIGASQRL